MADPDRVRTKLGHLEEAVAGLTDKQDCSLTEYRNDPDLRDVVERRFVKAIQASIDVAAHIVASEGYREPTDYGELFRILEAEGELTPTVADSMVEYAGFRNVLAHEYADIQDHLVHEHLESLEPFRRFAAEIRELVK